MSSTYAVILVLWLLASVTLWRIADRLMDVARPFGAQVGGLVAALFAVVSLAVWGLIVFLCVLTMAAGGGAS